MKITDNIRLRFTALTMLAAAFTAGCADGPATAGDQEPAFDPVGRVIQFKVGTEATRAGIPFMENDGRFICRMYYHQDVSALDDDLMSRDCVETWFEVDGNQGNAKYQTGTFPAYTPESPDYGNPDAVKFVWKNRLKHSFIALADYNRLKTDTNAGTLVMPETEYVTCDPEDIANRRYYYNGYDITSAAYTCMADQPDPILAMTTMKPAAATEEGNRVNLIFQHQLSQIQVNLKNATDGSVDIAASNILSVELLGVTHSAYVTNQPLEIRPVSDRTRAWPTFYNPFTVQQKKATEPPYGSAFSMFTAAAAEEGYLKTFECIAFGDLGAIRIAWEESTGGIQHIVEYPIIESTLTPLQSGRKYIYNIELRRSTISVLRAEILPWTVGDDYTVQGTAVPETTNP